MEGLPELKLPFKLKQIEIDWKHVQQCSIYPFLPPPFKEVVRRSPHLLEYLHLLPLEKTGLPRFYNELSRSLADLKNRNLIYPVNDKIYVHIYPDPDSERDFYISIEPFLTLNLEPIMQKVEERLLDYIDELAEAETDEERKEVLLRCIDKICTTNGKKNKKWPFGKNDGNNKIRVTERELEGIKYLIIRDKVGLGILDPIVQDKYIEDISCSGIGPIFIEHKIFRSLKTAITFTSYEELDEFVLKLAERIGKPLSVHNPIADAVLPDGSRINIVYGRDISKRGSNFTIRKFSEVPMSILELIELGTMNYEMAAYLSLVIEEGMNLFVSGETASGKTTTLNAITAFIPPEAKIVTIEDTPELQVPHKNWVREVASQSEKGAQVSMFDLLKAALRQRPNYILIGEIRGKEGAIAFQAMQTGHAVMATFHAASVEKLIQRLTGDPINVPKTYIDNLNVVVIQSAVKLPNGKVGRRVLSINEIVGYDSASDSFSYIEVFRWIPSEDRFEFVGNMNSYLLEQKIAVKRGIPPEKKRQIYAELQRRAKILERLHKEKGIKDYYRFLEVLTKARREGVF